ncbi:hypothetical protein [Streptomyces sp. NBC_01408]|uniref:hypothetical protein n=1 Tax=Streptomyces sp. NBC_01408 TaxID=2903855 RepID=UPI00224CF9F9|nr:hypothetical protein [Streptomyces sp. NBC_01408]MCX4693663.1 hypothetical protein [Streptomyces sp. NBC_01408]
MEEEVAYRAMLAVDIERSAGRGNVAFHQIREVLTAVLRESFEDSGIEWKACLLGDLGDGLRVIAPYGIRKTRLIHPLIHELTVRLRAHNRTAGPATRIRVRVALHAGDVFLGPAGEATGRPLEVLARLLDAAPARIALADAPESLTASLVVSEHFHEETVRHGYPGIDPESFHKVTLTEKEYTADAWLHLPGSATDPRHGAAATPTPMAASPESRMVNKASGNGVIYATGTGTQNIHLTGRS